MNTYLYPANSSFLGSPRAKVKIRFSPNVTLCATTIRKVNDPSSDSVLPKLQSSLKSNLAGSTQRIQVIKLNLSLSETWFLSGIVTGIGWLPDEPIKFPFVSLALLYINSQNPKFLVFR